MKIPSTALLVVGFICWIQASNAALKSHPKATLDGSMLQRLGLLESAGPEQRGLSENKIAPVLHKTNNQELRRLSESKIASVMHETRELVQQLWQRLCQREGLMFDRQGMACRPSGKIDVQKKAWGGGGLPGK